MTQDVGSLYRDLLEWRVRVDVAAHAAAVEACSAHPGLDAAVACLLDSDGSKDSEFRLLPVPVLGALTGDPEQALPVCVVSRVWWAGAETFDDLNDGEFDSAVTGLSAAGAAVASTACITLLPQVIVERQQFPADVAADLAAELLSSSLHSANGQIEDLAPSSEPISWARVMRSYVGKNGAPYGRDMAMAARLAGAGPREIAGWRAFGRLFGVLRQLVNDRASLTAEDDHDLANGTRTLLLAHALTVPGTAAQTLLDLRSRARDDHGAREELLARLGAPDVAGSYDERVAGIRRKLSDLLSGLLGESPFRDVIQAMVDVSASSSMIGPDRNAAA